jgi:hypothetical protein
MEAPSFIFRKSKGYLFTAYKIVKTVSGMAGAERSRTE